MDEGIDNYRVTMNYKMPGFDIKSSENSTPYKKFLVSESSKGSDIKIEPVEDHEWFKKEEEGSSKLTENI